jgi:hypothetical protein
MESGSRLAILSYDESNLLPILGADMDGDIQSVWCYAAVPLNLA